MRLNDYAGIDVQTRLLLQRLALQLVNRDVQGARKPPLQHQVFMVTGCKLPVCQHVADFSNIIKSLTCMQRSKPALKSKTSTLCMY